VHNQTVQTNQKLAIGFLIGHLKTYEAGLLQ